MGKATYFYLNRYLMTKRLANHDDMEINRLHDDISILKKQVSEVITLLGGSASYDYKGMRAEFRELKDDVSTIKEELEKMKRKDLERFSIKLDTVPQKVVATIAFLALILTVVQNVRELFQP